MDEIIFRGLRLQGGSGAADIWNVQGELQSRSASGDGRQVEFPGPLGPCDLVGVSLAEARVVIVDDVQANVDLLDRMLRSAGMRQVYGFTDARLAISTCV